MTLLKNVNIKSQDSPSIDAFGRWRVSNPQTIFDSKNIFDDDGLASNVENKPLFWNNAETAGSGTSTEYKVNEASQSISVSSGVAGTRVRQTKQRFNYQPGKSQEIIMTFNLNSQDSDVIKRVGYYDDNNGIFFEDVGSSYCLVRRTFTSGERIDNKVAQSSWNIDPMDGTGASGITLDFTKTQILFMDLEWLGVGRVRIGFVVDGLIYYAHEFLNANNLTVVYMSTPNLPLRYEITNVGSGVASSLDCICGTVISEGGLHDSGFVRYDSTSTSVAVSASGTIYAIMGVRLKTEYLGASVNILQAHLLETAGSKDLEWTLRFNPTVADTFTYNDQSNSACQTAFGATANTVTGGTIIEGGYFVSQRQNQSGSIESASQNLLRLGSDINGVSDSIVLCVKLLSGTNAVVFGGLSWRELV